MNRTILAGFKPELALPVAAIVQPDAKGNFTLMPDDADLRGNLKTEAQGGQPNIGFWDSAADSAAWKLNVKRAGKYHVTASVGTVHDGSPFVVEIAGQKLQAQARSTGGWDRFAELDLGTIQIDQPGEHLLTVKPRDEQSWKAMNLRWVKVAKE